MITHPSFRLFLLVIHVLAFGQQGAMAQADEDKKSKQQIRLIFLSCPEDTGELKLVSMKEDETWVVHHELKPRSPFISDWIEVPAGSLFLAEQHNEKTSRVVTITLRPGIPRAIALLKPSGKGRTYSVEILDPSKLDFKPGTTLVANFSQHTTGVALGKNKLSLKPGERKVMEPAAESNGMYRAMVGYIDDEGRQLLTYDRYVKRSNQGRQFLLLMPDELQGIRVFPLVEFGLFD
jgi:hypothetical protein